MACSMERVDRADGGVEDRHSCPSAGGTPTRTRRASRRAPAERATRRLRAGCRRGGRTSSGASTACRATVEGCRRASRGRAAAPARSRGLAGQPSASICSISAGTAGFLSGGLATAARGAGASGRQRRRAAERWQPYRRGERRGAVDSSTAHAASARDARDARDARKKCAAGRPRRARAIRRPPGSSVTTPTARVWLIASLHGNTTAPDRNVHHAVALPLRPVPTEEEVRNARNTSTSLSAAPRSVVRRTSRPSHGEAEPRPARRRLLGCGASEPEALVSRSFMVISRFQGCALAAAMLVSCNVQAHHRIPLQRLRGRRLSGPTS